VRSDNTTSAHHTIIFGAGTTAIAVQSIWTMSADKGTGTKYWVSLKTLSPQIFTSAHATFSFKCKRAVKSVSVTSTSTCIGGKAFSAVITVTPGPGSVSVTYTWKRSDGATVSAVTVIIPQDQATTTVTTTWTLTVIGSHWEEVATSSPNSITSNKATFTC
jgi:hypothetical protein